MSKKAIAKSPPKKRSENIEKNVETAEEDASSCSCFLKILSFFLVLLNVGVRVLCGLYMIISDCDETFNYWEPLNLIFRGFGKQTWEYSPAYAIRSYAYLIPYYLVSNPLRDLNFLTGSQFPPYYTFYYLRVVALCGFCSYAEIKLHQSVKRNIGAACANWFLLFSTLAPGMSHASAAFLPSSFAMIFVTLGTSFALEALLDNTMTSVRPSVRAIACFLVAGTVGWPFALVLGVPFGLYTMSSKYQQPPLTWIVLGCAPVVAVLMAYLLSIDSYFYERKMLFVPFNIVFYNVFALKDEGPEIFGVEPLSYYVKNLILNFNVVAPLGYLGLIINPYFSSAKAKSTIASSLPVMAWTYVFFTQPHKEERFLYPIYTLVCLSASVLVTSVVSLLQSTFKRKLITRLFVILSVLSYSAVSILRILNLVHLYSAPLTTAQIFHADSVQNPTTDIQNVCVGREWYHFPTSFFLPDNYRLAFVESGFDGLLPGDFPENVILQKAASAYPKGMNSKNLYSPDKVIGLDECHYFVDNTGETNPSSGEPTLIWKKNGEIATASGWEVLTCESMADPDGQSSGLGRILYIPHAARAFVDYNVAQREYCVLKKRG